MKDLAMISWAVVVTAALGANTAEGQIRELVVVDAEGNSCIASSPGTPTTFFVRATFEAMEPPGLEFRIAGLPLGWLVSVTPGPLVSFALGDVFGSGVMLALSTCDPAVTSALLYEVLVLPTRAEAANLSVMPHLVPSHPNVGCPQFVFGGCGPIYGWLCLPSGLRGIVDSANACQVGVAHRSWSAVRRLYE